jgi:hypothetical protein
LTRRCSFERNLFKFLIACQSCVLAGFGVAKYRSKLFIYDKFKPARDATKSSSQIKEKEILKISIYIFLQLKINK